MALEDFAAGFTRTYQGAADRGVQNYQFEQQHELAERAQAAKERVQKQEIARLRQQIDQARKMFPKRMEKVDTQIQGQQLQNEGQEIRNEWIPKKMEASVGASNAQANAADARANHTNFKTRVAREEYERQQTRRDMARNAPGTTPMPSPQQRGPSARVEQNRNNFYRSVVTNSPVGRAMQGAGAALSAIGLDGLGRDMVRMSQPENDRVGDDGRGRAYHGSVINAAKGMREKFNQEGVTSQQAAAQVYRNLQRGYQAIKNNTYNLPADERNQRLREYQQEMQYFQRLMPRQSPARQGLQQAGQRALENDNVSTAVDAYNGLRQMGGGGTSRQ